MRVGIYSRHLPTLGGGEKLSLAIAEYLSLEHSVTVISHSIVFKEGIEKRFGLDLSAVELAVIPPRSPLEMTPITAGYDLFINVTDMMYFPSRASRSVNLVYFPAPILPRCSDSWRWHAKMAARRWLRLPSFIHGLRRIETGNRTPEFVLDSPATMRIPSRRKRSDLSFYIRSESSSESSVSILLKDHELEQIDLHPGEWKCCHIVLPGSATGKDHELTIVCLKDVPERNRDQMRLTGLRPIFPSPLLDGLVRRLYSDLPKTWILDYLKSYDDLWAISEYTQWWIQEYWGLDSSLLYPHVDVDFFNKKTKRNRILSVGRFFAGRHNKKHLEMIRFFRTLLDQGLSDWELHLAGGVASGEAHHAYLEDIRQAAGDYPVVIHPDLEFEILVDLYGESKIYWHATGYGEDAAAEPAKFEHFGITTIEAMASGCVPVVIGKGGQPEIVQHGVSGFLWQQPEELQALTLQLASDERLFEEMSQAAEKESCRFDKAHFCRQLGDLLHRLGIGSL